MKGIVLKKKMKENLKHVIINVICAMFRTTKCFIVISNVQRGKGNGPTTALIVSIVKGIAK